MKIEVTEAVVEAAALAIAKERHGNVPQRVSFDEFWRAHSYQLTRDARAACFALTAALSKETSIWTPELREACALRQGEFGEPACHAVIEKPAPCRGCFEACGYNLPQEDEMIDEAIAEALASKETGVGEETLREVLAEEYERVELTGIAKELREGRVMVAAKVALSAMSRVSSLSSKGE